MAMKLWIQKYLLSIYDVLSAEHALGSTWGEEPMQPPTAQGSKRL